MLKLDALNLYFTKIVCTYQHKIRYAYPGIEGLSHDSVNCFLLGEADEPKDLVDELSPRH
jgi:hypothetical protein